MEANPAIIRSIPEIVQHTNIQVFPAERLYDIVPERPDGPSGRPLAIPELVDKAPLYFAIQHDYIGSESGEVVPESIGARCVRVGVRAPVFSHGKLNVSKVSTDEVNNLLMSPPFLPSHSYPHEEALRAE